MIAGSVAEPLEQISQAVRILAKAGHAESDPNEIRRVTAATIGSHPGTYDSSAALWLLEAARSVGLGVRALNCRAEDAWDLANAGFSLVAMLPGSEVGYLAIGPGIRKQIYVQNSAGHLNLKSAGELIPALKIESPSVVLEWVILEQRSIQFGHDADARAPKPLARFVRIVWQERRDLWVILVLAIAIGVFALAIPLAGQELARTVTFGAVYQPLLILSIVLFGFMTFLALLQGLQTWVVELIQRRVFARVVADLSWRLPRADLGNLEHHGGQELVNRFFDVVTVQKVLAGFLVDGTSILLTTMVGMTLLAFYHPFLLGYDIALLAMMAFVLFVLGRGGVKTAIDESRTKYHAAAWLEELVRCPLAFRTEDAMQFAVERADRLTTRYVEARSAHFRVLLRQIIALLSLQAIASTVLLGLGGYLVLIEQLSLGQLVAAELIVTMIVGSFAKILKHIENFFDLMASVEKLGHLFDLPCERSGGDLVPVSGKGIHLRLNDVVLDSRHDSHDEPEYGSIHHADAHSFSLDIQPGERVALMGPPGSGKSALADLLYGLVAPREGQVLFDGHDQRDLRLDISRKHVLLVRHPEMVSGTVAENLHMGNPDVDAMQMRTVLEQVGLFHELAHLSGGLQTMLTANGRPLSYSGTIRLTLARALANRPRLLVIDGLLDGLSDDVLDELVTQLAAMPREMTLLLITGRQKLMAACDRVIELHAETAVPMLEEQTYRRLGRSGT